MAEFSRLVITRKGQALIAKMIAGQGDIEFSRISASSMAYGVGQLEALEDLTDIRQTNKISKITRTNDVAVKVETAFSNTGLTEGYYMRTLGLYADDPDNGEILYAVTTETTGNCYMPAYNGVTVSGAYIQLISTVGNAEKVSIKINQAAIATIGNIQDLQAQIDEIWGRDADGNSPGFAEGIQSDNVIGAINEVFTLGNEHKQTLVDNLIAAGIDASTDETWGQLIDKVSAMTNTSGDTVAPAVLLAGYTAHNAAGEPITGAMPDRRGTTVDAASVAQDDEYTYLSLPEGAACYDVDSKVRAINSDIGKVYDLGTITVNGAGTAHFDASRIPGYSKLTVADFIVQINSSTAAVASPSGSYSRYHWGNGGMTAFAVNKEYDASTGQLSVNGFPRGDFTIAADGAGGVTFSRYPDISITAYAVIGDIDQLDV